MVPQRISVGTHWRDFSVERREPLINQHYNELFEHTKLIINASIEDNGVIEQPTDADTYVPLDFTIYDMGNIRKSIDYLQQD